MYKKHVQIHEKLTIVSGLCFEIDASQSRHWFDKHLLERGGECTIIKFKIPQAGFDPEQILEEAGCEPRRNRAPVDRMKAIEKFRQNKRLTVSQVLASMLKLS